MPQISPAITNSCKSCTARCCRGLAVVLTIPEAKRLLSAVNAPPEDLLEFSGQIDSKRTPHYSLLVKDSKGVREFFIVLKRRRKIDCIFLGEDLACTIYGDRPHVCRLYPFELDGKEMKKGALCPCKFTREAGTDETAAQLKRDLHEHGKIARAWNVKFGAKGVPDMSSFQEYFP